METRTKNIFLNTSEVYSMGLDAQPETDFVEFYVEGVYIAKVNVNELSPDAMNELGISTTPFIK